MMEMILLLVGALLGVVFLSLLERKFLSMVQLRSGPNKVIMNGIFQSFVDAIKLFSKEQMMLNKVMYMLYIVNPFGLVVLSLFLWIFLPCGVMLSSLEMGIMLVIAVLSLESYFLLFMGWYTSNKFSQLGSLRGVAQVISYEIVMFLLFLSFIMSCCDFGFMSLMFIQQMDLHNLWFMFLYLPIVYMIFLTEMNRSPMDLVEGESELVSGFNIEYMSFSLSLIFIGEFSKMIILMMIMVCLLLGIYMVMGLFLSVSLLVVRAVFPRYRYDILMGLCWKMVLPVGMGLFYNFIFM